jgi:hypothetical protein
LVWPAVIGIINKQGDMTMDYSLTMRDVLRVAAADAGATLD